MMVNHKNIVPNDEVFRYYFYFMQERMKMFWRKCEGCATLTNDPIYTGLATGSANTSSGMSFMNTLTIVAKKM